MRKTTTIVNSIINSINQNEAFNTRCQAVKSFERKSLPLPLKSTYISICAKKNTVSYDQQNNTVNDIIIKLTCYYPITIIPHTGNDLMEDILPTIKENYGDALKYFTVGEMLYDDSVKGYKMVCEIHFTYVST